MGMKNTLEFGRRQRKLLIELGREKVEKRNLGEREKEKTRKRGRELLNTSSHN